MSLPNYLQKYVPLLERYVLATDKKAFLKGLATDQERKFFDFLLDPIQKKESKIMDELGLPWDSREDIKRNKIMREFREAVTEQDQQKAITRVKQINQGMSFDYPRPVEVSNQNFISQQEQKGDSGQNSRLTTQETVEEVVNRALDENESNFMKLSEYGLKNFQLKKIKEMDEIHFGFMFQKKELVLSLPPEQVAEILSELIKKAAAAKKHEVQEECPQEIFEMLTTEQLEALKLRLPQLFESHAYYSNQFKRNYEAQLREFRPIKELSFDEKNKKKDLCLHIIGELRKGNHEFNSLFIEKLTEEVLLIEEAMKNTSLKFFIDYLKDTKSTSYSYFNNQTKKEKREKYGKIAGSHKKASDLSYLDSHRVNQNTIIDGSIHSLLCADHKKTVKELSAFISDKYLQKEEAKVLLSQGRQAEIKNLQEILTVHEIDSLREKRMITFRPENKEAYKVGEQVVLEVKVKNVKVIKVKVYKIDMEKQLIQEGRDIDPQVNLKYLIPAQQEERHCQCRDAFEELNDSIALSELKNSLGMFIVELEGQRVTSRAVIRKGTIITKNRKTQIGHELTFYDESGKQIKELSVWRDNKHSVVKGTYHIPYGKSRSSQELILVHEGYAVKQHVEIDSCSYSFKIDYIYHSESFIKGSKAKVVLHSSLKLNGKRIQLSHLKDTKITINTINNQNIAATDIIENVVFKDNEDYVLEIPVKAYLSKVDIKVEAEIQQIDKTKTKVHSVKHISIELEQNHENFVDLYLDQNSNKEYSLRVRGKNGEAITEASTSLSYQQFGVQMSFSNEMITDKNGEIHLNRLKQVQKLTATVNSQGYSSVRTWVIHDYTKHITFGSRIHSGQNLLYFKEGDSFTLPLADQLDLDKEVICYHRDQVRGMTSNVISQVKIDSNVLRLDSLKQGHYSFLFLRWQRRIDLEVIEGEQWMSNKLKDRDGKVYNLNGRKKEWLTVGDLKTEAKDKYIDCKLDIVSDRESLPSDLRIHVFAKNYRDSNIEGFYNSQQILSPPSSIKEYPLKKSNYYDNKSLSDETAYVLNRRNQEATTGNNLQKPHIFLKRVEVRDTQTKQEHLEAEGAYRVGGGKVHGALKAKMANMDECMDMLGGGYGGRGMQYEAEAYFASTGITLNRGFNTHNNFYRQVGYFIPNLSHSASFKVPKGYSQLVVVVIGHNVGIKKNFALPAGEEKKVDLSHPAIVDQHGDYEGWTMTREIYPLHAGEEREVSRSSTWAAVGLSEMEQYVKARRVNLPEWLLGWKGYSLHKKRQVYDKQCCHQLNFFIFRSDLEFFKSTVLPFVSNKINKTFLDHYFLDNKSNILEYSKVQNLHKLNEFERALLPEKLKQYELDKQAENVALSLELPIKNIKTSGEQFKTFFETVLNAKKEAKAPVPIPPPAVGMAPQMYMQQAMPTSLIMRGGVMEQRAVDLCAMDDEEEQNQCEAADMFFGQSEEMQKCEEADDNSYVNSSRGMMNQNEIENAKQKYKEGFKQPEKTKQYTQTTYSKVKDPKTIPQLIGPSQFWAQFAKHNSTHPDKPFLSWQFLHLNSQLEFILACSVLPQESQCDYQLATTETGYKISARSSFLVFVREVASLPCKLSKTVVLNQLFYDPKNRYIYNDDGSQQERQVSAFLVQKPYTLQTIITNISGFPLETQLLIDIPEGAMPLKSHEQTQITNLTLQQFSTQSTQRSFYFPKEGTYSLYPANATQGKFIVAKAAPVGQINVLKSEPPSNEQTLDNIMRSGSDEDILKYMQQRNIFDDNVFDLSLILWKLKNRKFYDQVLKLFRSRKYFNANVWSFSLYHGDFEGVREYLERTNFAPGLPQTDVPIFEYFPYYASRAHKFAKEEKSTIRVQQFKHNYARFLFGGIFEGQTHTPRFQMALVYYLLLQDRVSKARQVYKLLSKESFALQCDYVNCYLDMFDGANSDYKDARTISEKYHDYPVLSWRKLFREAGQALKGEDFVESEASTKDEQTYTTTVTNAGTELKINRPAKTKVVVNAYRVDIELYFSEYPFASVNAFSSLSPAHSITFEGDDFKAEKVQRKEFAHLKDFVIEVHEYRPNVAPRKVSSFLWTNPELKVKVNERDGTLRVFCNRKPSSGYCKVYTRGSKGEKFHRDGYTDVASTFRYALDVSGVTEFSILVLTQQGGSIHKVRPPSIHE